MNRHIIVAEPQICLCGVYGENTVGCRDIIAILERYKIRQDTNQPEPLVFSSSESSLLYKVLSSNIKDCT